MQQLRYVVVEKFLPQSSSPKDALDEIVGLLVHLKEIKNIFNRAIPGLFLKKYGPILASFLFIFVLSYNNLNYNLD